MRIQCGNSKEEEEEEAEEEEEEAEEEEAEEEEAEEEEEDCGVQRGVQRGFDVPLLSSLPKGGRKMDQDICLV